MNRYLALILIAFALSTLMAVDICKWDFDESSPEPSMGEGILSLIGGVTNDGYSSGFSGMGLSTTNYPAQGTANQTAGIMLEISTENYSNIQLSWRIRHSNKSANRSVMFYTLDRTAMPVVWSIGSMNTVPAGDTWYYSEFDASQIAGMANNPNLALKIVSAFGNPDETLYMPSKSTSTYAGDGKWRWDDILVQGTPLTPHLELVGELQTFYAAPGSLSEIQEYQLIGQNLISNIQIQAPSAFKIRINAEEDFSSQLNVIPRSGGIDKTIQVLFQPAAAGEYEGDITHQSSGLESLSLPVTGSTIKPQPSNHVSGFHSNDISYYQGWLYWQDSLGGVLPDGYLILGSKVSLEAIVDPVDGVVQADKKLTKNVPYGQMSQLIFELNEEHTYYFKIFPYTNSGMAIDYKTDGEVPWVEISTGIGPDGSELLPGDIAFVEYACDSPDRFSFVLLRDVAENTKIYFTDKAWTGTSFADGEELYLWRAVGREYLAGEVIHIVEGELYPDEGIYNPDFGGFSNDGDQIIAYQGYLAEPQFIAAFSSWDWLIEGTPTNNTSYLPEELTLGVHALGFATEIDNGVYIGATSGTAAELLLSCHNPANWQRANSLGSITFPEWDFQVLTGLAAPQNCQVQRDENSITIFWEAVAGAVNYRLYAADTPDAAFPADWQLIESEITGTSISLEMPDSVQRRFYCVSAQ